MKNTLVRFLKLVHKWLGIFTGLFVFIVAFTGCIYAFQKEIQDFLQPYRFIKKENKPKLLPSAMIEIAQKKLPNKKLHSITYYSNNRTSEAIFFQYNPRQHYTMYINPFSGKILHIQNMNEGFFNFILKGHMYLWFPEDIGKNFVLVITLIFIFMISSGLILWLPKKSNTLFKYHLKWQWNENTNLKRKIFDFHRISGFYTALFSYIFALTGLVWVLPIFAFIFYISIGGQKNIIFEESFIPQISNKIENPIDKIYLNFMNKNPKYAIYEIHPPETDSSCILSVSNPDFDTYYKNDYRYFNPNTLEEVNVKHLWGRFHEAALPDKILRLNYDIHVGSIGGIIGKFIAFLLSFIISLLALSGILMFIKKIKHFKSFN